MSSNNDKDCLIATLQQQLAATSVQSDNLEGTPFYKQLVKDPCTVGQAAIQLKDNRSNFDKWQSNINSILQLAFPHASNFLNDKTNFTNLTQNKDLIVQHLLKASLNQCLYIVLKGLNNSCASIVAALEKDCYGTTRSGMIWTKPWWNGAS
ncbi:hypothetical protein BY996DRAFT_6426082 [Phakopsora pachyrhizi]|nr:hypothetical protein BY996DRAFT_6426082 [Phakopsora pachyrhizi]